MRERERERAMATALELSPAEIMSGGSTSPIRLFQLSLNDVTVELSSLGASITKILLPNYLHNDAPRDDIVLSYAAANDQYKDRNAPFFGAIVGRVANRIKGGQFQLLQTKQSAGCEDINLLETYQLENNNGPNHLHGGFDGFSYRIWNAKVFDNAVQFTLLSLDGDQGYPGGIEVSATYSIVPIDCNAKMGAKICLNMSAKLLPGETKATPIALAQHSYFNLASHNSKERILTHVLQMQHCKKFTPVDNTSIPTRDVQRVDNSASTQSNGQAKAMDFRVGKVMADALVQYGEERAGLESDVASKNVNRILNEKTNTHGVSDVARVPTKGGASGANLDGDTPYGFDHNYVIDRNNYSSSDWSNMRLGAILSHPQTGRSLRVSTTAPGMQLYTSNYLDGSSPPPSMCKDGSRYDQWQGICLETQTYPDSIYPTTSSEETIEDDDFSEGRCFILRPGGKDYSHVVEYEFGHIPGS